MISEILFETVVPTAQNPVTYCEDDHNLMFALWHHSFHLSFRAARNFSPADSVFWKRKKVLENRCIGRIRADDPRGRSPETLLACIATRDNLAILFAVL
jgi:hypothetical protein